MTPLHQAVQDYLVLRRSLGFKLRWDGTKTGRYRPEDPVLKFLKSL